MMMQRISALLFLLCLLLPCAYAQTGSGQASNAPEGDAAAEVAMVTSVAGTAYQNSGGRKQVLELGARLQSGDEIAIETGSAALVFFAGDYLALEEGDRLLLGPTLAESRIGDGSSTRGIGPDEAMTVAADGVDAGPNDNLWQSQLASVSSIRADAGLIAVAPRLAISDPDPVFYWFDADTLSGAAERSYRLVLYDGSGAVIASQMVRGHAGQLNGTRFQNAQGVLRAEPRTHYSWTVLPDGAEPPAGPQDAGFVYVDRAGMDGAADIRARFAAMREKGTLDASSMHMLLARFYLDERERLFADAIPHLVELDALPGGTAYAREQLARMFLRFGNQVSTLAPRVLQPSVRLGAR